MEIGTYPLEKTSIFQGADAQQVQKMLGVILPSIKTYARGETICARAKRFRLWAIVLAGGATIELCDAWGNRSIIERLEPGEVFAEAYACLFYPFISTLLSAFSSLFPFSVGDCFIVGTCLWILIYPFMPGGKEKGRKTVGTDHTCPDVGIYLVLFCLGIELFPFPFLRAYRYS